ncbi:MAG TPA: ribosome maturation factor RimP [Acidimicrobiia bacterium]|nr:ribosome maturation factor RimP [Acidimicrobiia bacterium]
MVRVGEAKIEALRTAVEPAVAALGLDLYDIEVQGAPGAATVRITITKPTGVDLDAITAATRAVEPLVDAADPVNGSYLLEVSSPGIERTLRRREHYEGARDEQVSVKYHTADGPRRVHGCLTTVAEDHITVDDTDIPFADITQARTVFDWGPAPRPGKPRARAKERS